MIGTRANYGLQFPCITKKCKERRAGSSQVMYDPTTGAQLTTMANAPDDLAAAAGMVFGYQLGADPINDAIRENIALGAAQRGTSAWDNFAVALSNAPGWNTFAQIPVTPVSAQYTPLPIGNQQPAANTTPALVETTTSWVPWIVAGGLIMTLGLGGLVVLAAAGGRR